MKKLIFLIILFSTLLIFPQNNFFISSNVGYNIAYPKAPLRHIWGISYNIGGGIGYYIIEELSLEIVYQYNKHTLYTFYEPGNPGYQYLSTFILKWKYILLHKSSTNMYFSFGIGISNFEFNKLTKKNILTLFPGVGIKYDFSKHLGILFFAEFAFLRFNYIGEDLKYFPLQIGLQYTF